MAYLSQQVRSLLSQDFLNTIDPPNGGRMPAHSVVIGESAESRNAVIQGAVEATALVREQQVVTEAPVGARHPRQLIAIHLDCASLIASPDDSRASRTLDERSPASDVGVVFSSANGFPVDKETRINEFLRLNDLLSRTFPGAGGGMLILDHVSDVDLGMKRVIFDALSTERLHKKGLFNVHVVWSVDVGTVLPQELETKASMYRVANAQEEAAQRRQTEIAQQKSRERAAHQLAQAAVKQAIADEGELDEAIALFSEGMESFPDELVTIAVDSLRRSLAERIPSLSMPYPSPDEKRQLTTEVKKNIVRLLRDNDPQMSESRRNAMINGLIHPTARNIGSGNAGAAGTAER